MTATPYSRDRQLDLLRGIAVMGMFFFSLVLSLSNTLPSVLEHNVSGRLLPGDLVLSLFLFSSGVSIALLRSRYGNVWDRDLWRKVAKRLGVMLAASVFITPFSVGAFLGMDEVMLNAVLTVPALVLSGMGLAINSIVMAAIVAAYEMVTTWGMQVPFSSVYLGGYSGAIFFLPVMLAGVLVCHEWRNRSLPHALAWLGVLALAWYYFGTPDKLTVTPSFIALSCCICALLLYLLGRFHATNRCLEYCGRHSLRMWILMFVLLGPVRIYAEISLHAKELSLPWWQAVIVAVGWMGMSYFISRGWDRVVYRTYS
jgi:peptidoglycan/LPS O-acetylase OafA/YrhL